MREPLRNKRPSVGFNFTHEGHCYRATASRFPDGRLAELFLDAGKFNSPLQQHAETAAVLVSPLVAVRRRRRRDLALGPRADRRRPRIGDSAMTAVSAYKARRIRRHRSTKAQVGDRRAALLKIVAAQHPMTVRQVFYQARCRGVIDKTEGEYSNVQTASSYATTPRLPFGWMADNTRWQRKPRTYGGVQEAFNDTARLYRKALWVDTNSYVEIWLEKDALPGVVYPVTDLYDVPLMVARGYASLSFLHSAAEAISDLDVPAYIYHLGDFDPSGVNAGEKIEETLRELAPSAEIIFERIAVTPEQIEVWDLPTRPTKTSDSPEQRIRRHFGRTRRDRTR